MGLLGIGLTDGFARTGVYPTLKQRYGWVTVSAWSTLLSLQPPQGPYQSPVRVSGADDSPYRPVGAHQSTPLSAGLAAAHTPQAYGAVDFAGGSPDSPESADDVHL